MSGRGEGEHANRGGQDQPEAGNFHRRFPFYSGYRARVERWRAPPENDERQYIKLGSTMDKIFTTLEQLT